MHALLRRREERLHDTRIVEQKWTAFPSPTCDGAARAGEESWLRGSKEAAPLATTEREAREHRLALRLRFLAADAMATLAGKRPTYREVHASTSRLAPPHLFPSSFRPARTHV